MHTPCELRIIHVHWDRKDRSGKVEIARDPIPLEHDGTDWVAEVPTYPKLDERVYGQLAVAASDGTAVPQLLNASAKAVALTRIQAPDGGEWWIEKGKWKKERRYHDAPLCRHAGEARLQVNGDLIRLRIAPTEFSVGEFEQMLDAFRTGAWQLILDAMSPTRATHRRADGGINPEFRDAVAEFLRYAGRAFDQPHRELREVREQQPIERVRPHAGTFRELAVRGEPRLVSGRGHAPSFDTPENRRLRAMCARLRSTLGALCTGAERKARDLDRQARADAARADEIQGMRGFAKVDEARLGRWLERLQSDLDRYPQAVQRLLDKVPEGSTSHRIELRVTKDPDFDRWGEVGFRSHVLSIDGRPKEALSFRFFFRRPLMEIKGVFREGCTYHLTGMFETVRKPEPDDQSRWWKAEVRLLIDIDSNFVRVVSAELDRFRGSKAALARAGYRRRLNRKDAGEQQLDLAEARRLAEMAQTASGAWSELATGLTPLVDRVFSLEDRARKLGIRKAMETGSSGSMTYVLNPDYRGAAAAYRRALEHASLTTEQLDGLLRLEDLGILDLWMVYERWCLLRIVAVLRERFQLVPPADFRERLLGCVMGGDRLALHLTGAGIGRDLLLEYQPRLPREGKREEQCPNPDFMLTLLPHGDHRPFRGHSHSKLVLDAKYKPFAPVVGQSPEFSLIEELDELVGRKSYNLPDDHRVFVLHPGPDSEASKRAGDYCHYGGSYLTVNAEDRKPWEDGPPDHRYGAAMLRPGVDDPLVRLILMHLYLGLDDSLGSYDKQPAYPMICPVCGSAEMTEEPPPGTGQIEHRGRARWCSSCGRMQVWNYSGGCGTHLFKLGGYWTFHETHPLNPYNICCPYCGDYMRIIEDDAQPGEDAGTNEPEATPWPL